MKRLKIKMMSTQLNKLSGVGEAHISEALPAQRDMAGLAIGSVSIEGYPLHVDTPAAYRSPYVTHPQHMRDVGELNEQMDKNAGNAMFNPDLVATEEARLGVNHGDDPEAFLRGHNALLLSFRDYLQEVMPQVKERSLTQVSQYLGKGEEAAARDWRERLESRLAASSIYTLDHLRSSVLANMSISDRSIMVNSAFAFVDMEAARYVVEGIILPHELIHAMSTSAVLENGLGPHADRPGLSPVRNGITTEHIAPEAPTVFVTQAGWVGEASIEDFRGRAMGPNKFGYTRGLALLRAVKELDPTLEEAIDSTLFDRTPPVVVTQKLEDVLGPLGVNRVEQYVSNDSLKWNPKTKSIDMVYSPEEFIAKVEELALPEVREKLDAALRHQLQTIVSTPKLPPGVISMH